MVRAAQARQYIHIAHKAQQEGMELCGHKLEREDQASLVLEGLLLQKVIAMEPLTEAERATCTELLATVMLQIQSGGHFALDMQQLQREIKAALELERVFALWEEGLPAPEPPQWPPPQYYIRLDTHSPKAIATSPRCLAWMNRTGPPQPKDPPEGFVQEYTEDAAMLYLLPWDVHRDEKWEFRCFVASSRLSAVSQRVWAHDLASEGVQWAQPNNLRLWATHLARGIEALAESLSEASVLPESYVLDVFVRHAGEPNGTTMRVPLEVPGQAPAVLEVTQVLPFGAQFQVHSRTFHWVQDRIALHHGAEGKPIVFRYIVDNEKKSR